MDLYGWVDSEAGVGPPDTTAPPKRTLPIILGFTYYNCWGFGGLPPISL